MEQKGTIYTYGNERIEVKELLPLLYPYSINCVVDCRHPNMTTYACNTPVEELNKQLKINHIFYIPFYEHFGHFSQEVQDKRGHIIYKKVIKTDSFQKGVERIKEGVSKGFSICLIDNTSDTPNSKRFNLIGAFLKEMFNVLHLSANGHYISHIDLEQRIEERNARRKVKKEEALEIGKTGEELASLYLIKNNYRILDRNWNLHKGCELDIVAMKDNKLHFIEVKTRSSDKYGEPQIAIDRRKIRHIRKAMQEYRYRRGFCNIESQIDSIAIIYKSDDDYTLNYYSDIGLW